MLIMSSIECVEKQVLLFVMFLIDSDYHGKVTVLLHNDSAVIQRKYGCNCM